MRKAMLFVVLTLSVTYALHGVLAVLLRRGMLNFYDFPSIVLFTVGGATPTVFALVFVYFSKHRQEQQRFLASLITINHPPRYWLFALLIAPMLGGLFLLGYSVQQNVAVTLTNPWYWYFYFFAYSLVVGGLEEVGWRGFLQERIQRRFHLLGVALIVGVVWASWHVPLLIMGGVGRTFFDVLPYLLGLFMFSLYLTALYARTGSILLTVVFHATINATRRMTAFRIVWDHSSLTYALLAVSILVGVIFVYRANPSAHQAFKRPSLSNETT